MKENKNKSLISWFDELVEPYSSQAKKNVIPLLAETLAPSLAEAIKTGFIWGDTPRGQGFEYWKRVWEKAARNSSQVVRNPTEFVDEVDQMEFHPEDIVELMSLKMIKS